MWAVKKYLKYVILSTLLIPTISQPCFSRSKLNAIGLYNGVYCCEDSENGENKYLEVKEDSLYLFSNKFLYLTYECSKPEYCYDFCISAKCKLTRIGENEYNISSESITDKIFGDIKITRPDLKSPADSIIVSVNCPNYDGGIPIEICLFNDSINSIKKLNYETELADFVFPTYLKGKELRLMIQTEKKRCWGSTDGWPLSQPCSVVYQQSIPLTSSLIKILLPNVTNETFYYDFETYQDAILTVLSPSQIKWDSLIFNYSKTKTEDQRKNRVKNSI